MLGLVRPHSEPRLWVRQEQPSLTQTRHFQPEREEEKLLPGTARACAILRYSVLPQHTAETLKNVQYLQREPTKASPRGSDWSSLHDTARELQPLRNDTEPASGSANTQSWFC